jgi:hypothetical protein
MKYKKPSGTPSPEEDLEQVAIEMPEIDIPAATLPCRIYGFICIDDDVSRVKVCLTNDSTAEGIEIYDGNTLRYKKEGDIVSRILNVYIHNIAYVHQTSPYVYLFFLVDGTWRACTSTEGGIFASKIEVISGKQVWNNIGCVFNIEDGEIALIYQTG